MQKRKGQRMKSEAELLRKTYQDKLTVVRGFPGMDESGESIREKRKVYENVPCALSQNSTGSPKREDNRRVSDTEHVIFTPPDVRIVDMDRATVVTQAGQVLRGVCGRTFIYAGSHGETPFYIEEMP